MTAVAVVHVATLEGVDNYQTPSANYSTYRLFWWKLARLCEGVQGDPKLSHRQFHETVQTPACIYFL